MLHHFTAPLTIIVTAMKKLFVTVSLVLSLVVIVGAAGYSTTFPLTENPISESSQWTNGKAVGLDWSDVRTTPGLAFGLQSGSSGFDDSIAVLKGSWAPDQSATAKVRTVNQRAGSVYEEVEILLRFSITAHNAHGYEVLFSLRQHDGSQYVQIVRWNGALGSFTYVHPGVTGPGLNDGDTVKATIVGNVITGYINGTQVIQATDNTFSSGNPGMGFYLQGISGVNSDYGFKNFVASAGGTPPAAPTNLRIIRLF
jgi:hypothetical protein